MNAREIRAITWIAGDLVDMQKHLEDSQADNTGLTDSLTSLLRSCAQLRDAGMPRRADAVLTAIKPARHAIETRKDSTDWITFENTVTKSIEDADHALCAEPKSEVVSQFDLDHTILGPDNYVVVGIEQALSYLDAENPGEAEQVLKATLEQIESERETSQI